MNKTKRLFISLAIWPIFYLLFAGLLHLLSIKPFEIGGLFYPICLGLFISFVVITISRWAMGHEL